MKIGVMVCSFYLLPDLTLPARQPDLDLEKVISLTAEAGLSGLELQEYRSGMYGFSFPDLPPKGYLQKIASVAESRGLELPAISVMAGSLLDPSSAVQLKYVRRWLKTASQVGIGTLKINLGKKPRGTSNDEAFERARQRLRLLVKDAEESGVVLAPELWPPSYPTSDTAAMLTLVNNIDSPFLKLTLDNYMLPSDWAVEAYRLLAPKAVHVHFSTPKRGDQIGANRNRFRFKEFVRILKRNNYDGYLMIEWRSPNRPVERLVKGLVETKEMLEGVISSA